MKRAILPLLIALVCLCLPIMSYAEEEDLAPGFNACMDKANNTASMLTCVDDGIKYWNGILAENYIQAEKDCPFQDKGRCAEYLSLLRASMKSWETYRNDTASYLNQATGGTMDQLQAAMFILQATQQYARAISVEEP